MIQIQKPKLIKFPKISDVRGNLTFIQSPDHIPFDVQRVFMTYDVPGGDTRGGHAYHQQQEIIIALSGSFDIVILENGEEQRIHLNRSYFGLYLPPLTWRFMDNFSTNSVALHLTDRIYDPDDYIRDFKTFASISQK